VGQDLLEEAGLTPRTSPRWCGGLEGGLLG